MAADLFFENSWSNNVNMPQSLVDMRFYLETRDDLTPTTADNFLKITSVILNKLTENEREELSRWWYEVDISTTDDEYNIRRIEFDNETKLFGIELWDKIEVFTKYNDFKRDTELWDKFLT